MAFDFENGEGTKDNEDFYTANFDGPLGSLVLKDLPNEVCLQSGMNIQIETSIRDKDINAMRRVVALTCTADFHKRKGYIDSDEKSTLTLRQLERLFGLPDEYNPSISGHSFRNKFIKTLNDRVLNNESNALFELKDVFVLICSEGAEDSFTINKEGWEAPMPTHRRGIMYVLTHDAINEWTDENQYLADCSTMINRIELKPIVVFQKKDVITRGNIKFTAREIYNEFCGEFTVLLEFKGVFEASQKNDVITLSKTGERFTTA